MTNPAVVQEDRNITQKYRTLFNQGVERGGGLDHHERIMGSRDQFFRRLFIANVKKKKTTKKRDSRRTNTRNCALSPTDRISYPAHRCRVV
jgi:hypothetical protein